LRVKIFLKGRGPPHILCISSSLSILKPSLNYIYGDAFLHLSRLTGVIQPLGVQVPPTLIHFIVDHFNLLLFFVGVVPFWDWNTAWWYLEMKQGQYAPIES